MFKLPKKLMNDEPVDGGAPAPKEAQPEQVTEGSWFDSFSEDIRGNQDITKFNSAEELAKSYINAQTLIGRDNIPMPVTEDDWANTYNRLGRPETADGYELQVDSEAINPEFQQSFLEKAHSLGLSNKQVQALTEWNLSLSDGSEEVALQQEQATQEAVESLKKDWGNAFEQNVNIANRALNEFVSSEDIDFITETEIGGVKLADHPVMARILHNVGKGLMEDVKFEGKGNELVLSPNELQDKQSSLMAHPAYFDRNHPEHASIKRQVTDLFKLQYKE